MEGLKIKQIMIKGMTLYLNEVYNFKLNNKIIKGKLIGKEHHICQHCKTNRNCMMFQINNKIYYIGSSCLYKITELLQNHTDGDLEIDEIYNCLKEQNKDNIYFDLDKLTN